MIPFRASANELSMTARNYGKDSPGITGRTARNYGKDIPELREGQDEITTMTLRN